MGKTPKLGQWKRGQRVLLTCDDPRWFDEFGVIQGKGDHGYTVRLDDGRQVMGLAAYEMIAEEAAVPVDPGSRDFYSPVGVLEGEAREEYIAWLDEVTEAAHEYIQYAPLKMRLALNNAFAHEPRLPKNVKMGKSGWEVQG